jgi:hypothetical protein
MRPTQRFGMPFRESSRSSGDCRETCCPAPTRYQPSSVTTGAPAISLSLDLISALEGVWVQGGRLWSLPDIPEDFRPAGGFLRSFGQDPHSPATLAPRLLERRLPSSSTGRSLIGRVVRIQVQVDASVSRPVGRTKVWRDLLRDPRRFMTCRRGVSIGRDWHGLDWHAWYRKAHSPISAVLFAYWFRP